MAANAATVRNYFQGTLLIQDNDARNALTNQGLDDWDSFLTVTDQDIQDICKNIRSPGGLVTNQDGDLVPNRGINIGFVFEKRLRQLRYFICHCYRIQRPFAPARATLPNLISIWRLHELEKKKEKDDTVTKPSLMTNVDDIRKTIESIDESLARCYGSFGIPLSYVIREEADLPDVDPGFMLPSLQEELTSRTRHDGSEFTQDNSDVFELLRVVFHGGPGWNWIKQFSRNFLERQPIRAACGSKNPA